MNIIFFIRLLLRHLWLLIAMPVLLFILVFFFTREQPKKYVSETTIYTGIASGSSIVSLEDNRTDLFGTRTAFDNLIGIIKSKTTLEEVGLRLFTSHMLIEEPGPPVITKASYTALMKIVPGEVKKLVVENNFEQTYQNFVRYKNKNYQNFIYELIHLNHPHYSARKILSKLRVSRVQSSDMIEISYNTDDPGICYHTLLLINEIFVKSYAELKINQSDAVVKYFQGQLNNAQDKLDEAEKELLAFNQRNNIINYYEQTKHISSEKQIFELDFLRIKMDHAAAKSVLEVLEKKLSSRQKNQLKSSEILNLRKQLADIHLKIATRTQLAPVDSSREDAIIGEISELKLQAYRIQEKLKETVDEKYQLDNSVEGLATTTVLEDWLQKVIEFESTKAQLEIGKKRQKEFEQLYVDYAPLGANMKRLERKIDVAEREYLSLLESLNTAKLKQQNVELNTNLKVSQPPFFPIQAEPSKRKYLLIIALMVGFLIPAFVIIALEYMDSNIKNARRAEKLTQLPVASIYPSLVPKNKKVDMDYLEARASEKIAQKIMLQAGNSAKGDDPVHIAFLSNRIGEGKTTLLRTILKKLAGYGYKCLLLSPDDVEPSERLDVQHYQAGQQFARVQKIKTLKSAQHAPGFKYPDFTFIEIPGLIENAWPITLLKKMDITYLVTRSNRPWGEADNNVVCDLQKITPSPPQILLNGVAITEMEAIVGELPRKRSFFRRIMKNIFSLQFFSKKAFKKSGD